MQLEEVGYRVDLNTIKDPLNEHLQKFSTKFNGTSESEYFTSVGNLSERDLLESLESCRILYLSTDFADAK